MSFTNNYFNLKVRNNLIFFIEYLHFNFNNSNLNFNLLEKNIYSRLFYKTKQC